MLQRGESCEFQEVSEDQRTEDLEAALDRENHKTASTRSDLLSELAQEDIVAGFQVPILADSVRLMSSGFFTS